MKDNWNELFDSMKEGDILRNLPEDLPEMEDELAAKRIENRVLEELELDLRLQKKWKRKRILAAAVCCIAMVGLLGHKPILAAFERLFHDLPGVGVYINEEDKKIYEVQIDDPVQEQDGVRVELKDFYVEGNILYGTFSFTGEGLRTIDIGEEDSSIDRHDILKEKFQITYYYKDKERTMFAPRTSSLVEDGKLEKYERHCEEFIPVKEGVFDYEIAISGFDRRFHLKLVEPKTVETPEELGYSQTLNDTTITARAAIVGDRIEFEYYMIPSAEVKMALENRNRYFIVQVPYQFNFEDQQYVENAAGKKMVSVKSKALQNGVKYWYEGSAADFPLTLHRPTLTGTNNESYTIDLKLPADGEMITNNLPKLEFQYGTVEIIHVAKEIGEYDNRDEINPEISPAAIVDIVYRITPKDGQRQMYGVEMDYFGDDLGNEWYGSEGLDAADDDYTRGTRIYLKDLESESVELKFHMPSFWILGDYDIVVEKPVYQEDIAASIDEEKDTGSSHFTVSYN